MQQGINAIPRPVLKWAGGKRGVLAQLERFVPKIFDRYLEPFVGGGALFFFLQPERAVLIDNNPELINVYEVIKENVEELVESLKQHVNEKAYYYTIRNADRNRKEFGKWNPVERASRTIFMNRVCFNGLYRVNKNGEFNVPFGKYKNPVICDEENLFAVSQILQDIIILKDTFEKCLDFANEGDFIYFDPPYVPLSTTASFTSYTKSCFGSEEQIRLYNVFKKLDESGCKLMLSNSHCEFILDLYKDYRIETIMAGRAINSNASRRGAIKEVLVLNSP